MHQKTRRGSLWYRTKRITVDLLILGIVGFFGINLAILYGSQGYILQATDVSKVYDILIIPGASVAGLKLSAVLQDRVETAIQLYKSGKAKKLMVSGDNGTKYYDEVTAMYTYIVNRGIPNEDILIDTQGDNTYETILHATGIPGVSSFAIATQKFHLPRALFIAHALGIQADGILADRSVYTEASSYETRERFSRIKSFFLVLRRYI